MSRAPTDPLAGTPCEITHPWEATHDRTPYENLRALMRALAGEAPISEITAIALRYIPGLGPGDEHIVETIREEFAEEHALARVQQWLNRREEPPQITLADHRRRLPADTDGVVHPAEVRAVVAHRLGARPPRPCATEAVSACSGPDHGCRCPACGQQRRREDAMLDALLDLWENQDAPQLPQPVLADGGAY